MELVTRTPEQRIVLEHYLGQLAATQEAISLFADNCFVDPVPIHTSKLSGYDYIQEILANSAHPRTCRDVMRMNRHAFLELRKELVTHGGLKASRYMTTEEMIGIFLFIVGGANSNRDTQDRFQRSGDGVSRSFHRVLNALYGIYPRWVKLPNPLMGTPREIRTEPKYSSYFSKCLGTLDGSHIYANPDLDDRKRCRNRKGWYSQNMLGVCSFDLRFTYI